MTGSRRTSRKWTPAELEQLDEMLGNMPYGLLVPAFNRWLTSHGLPRRTERAIAHKVTEIGNSRLSFGKWIGVGDAARALNRWPSTIWDWAKRGLIRRYHAGHASAVRRDDLRALARSHPHLFGGASREGLMQVLEDERLVDSIRERFPRHAAGYGGTRRVRWVERDIVFPSIRAAAEAVHVTESAIRGGLQKGRPVVGWTFEALD